MFGTTSLAAMFLAVLPVVWTLPLDVSNRQFKIPTCAAEQALIFTNNTFESCEPTDLGCLCGLDQDKVTEYVSIVQPWIDGAPGKGECTPGARYQYKELFKSVCESEQFNKVVDWVPLADDDAK